MPKVNNLKANGLLDLFVLQIFKRFFFKIGQHVQKNKIIQDQFSRNED